MAQPPEARAHERTLCAGDPSQAAIKPCPPQRDGVDGGDCFSGHRRTRGPGARDAPTAHPLLRSPPDRSERRASELVDEALTALGQVVLWCPSVADDDARLQREITRIAAALDEVLRAPDGLAALEALLRYLVATHGRFGAKKVVKLLENAAGPQAQAPPARQPAARKRARQVGRAGG